VYIGSAFVMRFLSLQPLISVSAVVGATLLAPWVAHAAEPTPSEISVARRLFEEGKAGEDAGRWRDAAVKFRQAAAIKDTPGIRFHLARCEEEQGAFVEALVEYDRARELIDGGVKAPDVERLLVEARERVRGKVALVTLRLPEGVANASVSVDGKAVSASVLGVPLPLNPGKHRLQAAAPGRTAYDQPVQLATGEAREIAIELPSAAVSPTVPPPRPGRSLRADSSSAHTGVSTRTIVLVGEASLFAAALGTGIVFSVARGGSAEDRFERANQNVIDEVGGADPSGNACSPPDPALGCADLERARHERDQARSQAGSVALAGFIAAGVSAAAFGVTWWLWPNRSAPAEANVGFAPGRVDLALSGRF
jgi:hypothetical protein